MLVIQSNPVMKRPFCSLIILLVCLWGCQPNSTNEINPVVNECVGSSQYFISNQSSYDLTTEFVFSAEMGNKTDSLRVVPSKQVRKVGQDGIFGAIPQPTNTYARLIIYRIVNGKLAIVYTQNPVVNDRWTKIKRNATDPDYGCYAVTNTLTINDQDLK